MKLGSLFTGYGGLDLAVERVFGATTAWTSDVDPGARKIIAHRYPGVPNLGDVTKINWATVEPVDVMAGGSPCQDVSTGGRRAGMTDGTRSNLWIAMREGIAHVRPRFVVWENVRGALSANATSAMESDPRLLGDHPPGQPVLRALGRVLGDLAGLGYDAQWHGLRVSDIGGCHHRFRIFVLAYTDGEGLEGLHDPTGATPPGRHGHPLAGAVRPGVVLPTPRATDGTKGGPNQRGSSGDLMLPSAVCHLPTPRASDTGTPGRRASEGFGHPLSQVIREDCDNAQDWGKYAPAIASHAALVGRPAPDPTEPNTRGGRRLSPAFTEWMMCLPAGWITDTPGITRNEALKACGNGVVPQQAIAALHTMSATP